MKLFQTPRRKVDRFLRMPVWVMLCSGPIWVLLGIAKGCIAFIPFKHLISCFGVSIGVAPHNSNITPEQARIARQIGKVVSLVARYTPWESNCFPRAIVASLLLRLKGVPYGIYFGVGREAKGVELVAHSWVMAGAVPVTGGLGRECFVTVGVFVHPAAIP